MYTGLTKEGEKYLANRVANELPVVFTKVKIGNGHLAGGVNPAESTQLISFKKEIEILEKVQNDNIARLRVLIENSDIESGFFMKELGVYVQDEIGREILYWYVYEDNGQFVYSKDERAIQFDLELLMEVSSNDSTILNWSGEGTWISKKYFDEKVRTFQIANVEEMIKRKNLKVGDIVELLGYYTTGDGAGHKRVIACEDDNSGVQLSNGLWANKVNTSPNLFEEIFHRPNVSQYPELTNCRIPAIITTNKGTIIAGCDLRNGYNDVPNRIKIGIRRSKNQGCTWEGAQVIMNLGDSSTDGISDPCLVHNSTTGRTFCFALNLKTGTIIDPNTEWGFYMTYSDDDGESWAPLKNISNLVPDGWRIIFQGPGRGCEYNGTIYVPIQCWQGTDGTKSKSGVMYSTDNGVNWTVTPLVERVSSECAVAVYKGRVYLSCKDELYKYGRFLYVLSEDKSSWTELVQDTYSTSTQGSLISISGKNTTEILVKCENNGLGAGTPRTDMTIKVSEDGIFWKEIVQVRDANGLGYSCLTHDDDYLYVHYEDNVGCVFKRFPIQQFRDIAVRSNYYNANVLTNPSIIDGCIYVQDSTEVVLFNKDVSSEVITKIKSEQIGKRIKITVVGSSAKVKLMTSATGKFGIRDVLIGANKEFTLSDGDQVALYQSQGNVWLFEDVKQFTPYAVNSIPSNGIIDLNNYLVSEVVINSSGTIKGFSNVASKGRIQFTVKADVVLDLGSMRVDGVGYKRILLVDGCSFDYISSQGSNPQVNVYGKPDQLNITDNNFNLFEYDETSKSIKLFDNIHFYIISKGSPILDKEINYIRLFSNEKGFVRFLVWTDGTGKIVAPSSGSTSPGSDYNRVFIPTNRGDITFTSGAVIDIMKTPSGITAIKL